jgi:von Willebrand factor type A domain
MLRLVMRRASRVFAAAAPILAAIATIASCGSRTPLTDAETADDTTTPDANVTDAGKDAPREDVTDAPVCVPGRFVLEPAAAQLMFVLDRSGSMKLDLAGNPPRLSPSRWSTLETGLRQTIVPFSGQISMGAKFFPEPATNQQDAVEACRSDPGVGIAPALNNANAILDVFKTTKPLGGTPTAEAVRLAAEYVAKQRTVARAIVLATDGAPNCNAALDRHTCTCTGSDPAACSAQFDGRYECLDDARSISVIGDIFKTRQIPVYVVGIGGSELLEYLATLDAMAVAGGRPKPTSPKYYDVQTPTEMNAALTTIRDSVSRCTFLTPSVPADPNAISIEINGASVPRDETHAEGWDWVDQAYGVVAFFGAACTSAGSGSAKVGGVVACPE